MRRCRLESLLRPYWADGLHCSMSEVPRSGHSDAKLPEFLENVSPTKFSGAEALKFRDSLRRFRRSRENDLCEAPQTVLTICFTTVD